MSTLAAMSFVAEIEHSALGRVEHHAGQHRQHRRDQAGADHHRQEGQQDLLQFADVLHAGDRAGDRAQHDRHDQAEHHVEEDVGERLQHRRLLAQRQAEDGANHHAGDQINGECIVLENL